MLSPLMYALSRTVICQRKTLCIQRQEKGSFYVWRLLYARCPLIIYKSLTNDDRLKKATLHIQAASEWSRRRRTVKKIRQKWSLSWILIPYVQWPLIYKLPTNGHLSRKAIFLLNERSCCFLSGESFLTYNFSLTVTFEIRKISI